MKLEEKQKDEKERGKMEGTRKVVRTSSKDSAPRTAIGAARATSIAISTKIDLIIIECK